MRSRLSPLHDHSAPTGDSPSRDPHSACVRSLVGLRSRVNVALATILAALAAATLLVAMTWGLMTVLTWAGAGSWGLLVTVGGTAVRRKQACSGIWATPQAMA